MLLSNPIVAAVLQALAAGPQRQSELRRVTGSPAQTTLRAQLRRLEEMEVLEGRRRNRFPGVLEYELTAIGRELLAVLDALERWLARSPHGPMAVGESAARAAIKAFAEGWSNNILRALAASPLSLTELDGVIAGLSYPSLERRLTGMRLAGLIEARAAIGRGTPYSVTMWLRQGLAPLAAAARWERRHAAATTAPIGRLDVEAAFLLTMPSLRASTGASGTCRLAVELPNGDRRRLVGVVVELGTAGRVEACTTNLEGRVDAWALGSTTAWLNAVLEKNADRLEVGGDGRLAGALIEAMHRALFQVQLQAS